MSDPTLTLLYEFAKRQTLAASRGLGPTLSIVRAGNTATRVNSNKLIEAVAANVARFDHDPVTGASLGLLVEELRTNLALQSGDLVTAPWTSIQTPGITTDNAISPRGLLEVTLFTDNNATNREGVQQSITVPNNSATHTSSVFVKKTTGAVSPTFGLEMNYSGGTQTAPVELRLNTDTGETNGEGGGGTQAQDYGDHWRAWGRSVNNGTGNTTLQVKVFPALAAHGSFVDVASTTGSAHAWGVQTEDGGIPTSYIETAGVAVLRAGDVITTTDISWLNVLEGTFFTDTITPVITNTGVGTPAILRLDDGSESNRIIHTYDREVGFFRTFFFMTSSGGGGARNRNDTGLVLVEGDRLKMASSWGGTSYNVTSNGRPILIDAGATMPVGLTTLRLSALGGVVQSNGHIREVRYYNVDKSQTEGFDYLRQLARGHISNNPLDFLRPVVRDLVQPPFRRL